MKPLDLFRTELFEDSHVKNFLSSDELKEYIEFSEQDHESQLKDLLNKPIARFTVINELYFRSRWAELIQLLYDSKAIRLLEIASGDADMIPQAISRSNPGSRYITANMNRLLNDSMLEKTKNLNLELQLIDNDASEILHYLEPDSVDLIAFQHAVNDILQAILCSQHCIDTIYSDWMSILPDMITLLQVEMNNNTLEASVKEPFLSLIRSLLIVLKPDGLIAINHYMFQLDLDWGYPKDLFENLLPIVRPWLLEVENCIEVTLDGFDSQWWIFLRKL